LHSCDPLQPTGQRQPNPASDITGAFERHCEPTLSFTTTRDLMAQQLGHEALTAAASDEPDLRAVIAALRAHPPNANRVTPNTLRPRRP